MNELKNIWKQNKYTKNYDEISSKIRQIEKKQKREKVLLTLIFVFISAFLIIHWYIYEGVYYVIGLIFIIASMGYFIYEHNRRKITTSGNLTTPNSEYIKSVHTALKKQHKNLLKKVFVFGILFLLGINISYMDALSDKDATVKIIIFVITNVLTVLLIFVGYKKYKSKLEEEIKKFEEFIIK